MQDYTLGLIGIRETAPGSAEEKRRCADESCGAILNRYNQDKYCSLCRRKRDNDAKNA